ENHCISIRPSQKFGIDKPNKATSMIAISENVYCLTAEMIPAIKPRKILKIVLYTANSNVTQNFGHNSCVTGKLVRQEYPNSSIAASLTKLKYCIGIGSFNPRRSSICSTVSFGALSPAIMCAGLPGVRCINENTRI